MIIGLDLEGLLLQNLNKYNNTQRIGMDWRGSEGNGRDWIGKDWKGLERRGKEWNGLVFK